MDTIWNQRWEGGGYPRYNVTGEDNPPAPWPLASMLVARASAAAGEYARVWKILEWLDGVAGLSGSWFERCAQSITPPMPPVGVVGWTWYEIINFCSHHIAGLRPDIDALVLKPRLPDRMDTLVATHLVRGSHVHLRVKRGTEAPGTSQREGCPGFRRRNPHPLSAPGFGTQRGVHSMKRNEFLRYSASAAFGAALFPAVPFAGEAACPAVPRLPPGVPGEMEGEKFWEFVRTQFPLSHERAYLNTGGLGASPFAVIDAVKGKIDELEKVCETGHSEELLDGIKKDAGTLLGCDVAELAFTRNTTEGINIVANGLPLKRGDEVILTTQEHVANAFTWLALAKREGIVIRLFEPSTVSDQANVDALERCITKRTRLISIPHALTTTGTIMPVRPIAGIAAAKKIWFFVDGAQTAGMMPFSLHDIGCDAYATSGHKWLLGPKETGLLYVRKEMLDTIAAKFTGAYSGPFDLAKGTVSFEPSAQRYEYGTVSIPLRVGLGAAIAFIRDIGIERIWKRDRMLADALVAGLGALPSISSSRRPDPALRTAMVTIQHRTVSLEKLEAHLDTYNMRTRSVTEGGLAALRLSFHLYNTPGEVSRVLEALSTVPKG